MKARRRSTRFAAMLAASCAAMLAASCAATPSSLFGDGDEEGIAKAIARCETEGKLRLTPPVPVEGLFVGDDNRRFSFDDAAEKLVRDRFAFVEYQRRLEPVGPGGKRRYHNGFGEDKLGRQFFDEKYIRLFVAPASDARCKPFEHWVRRMTEVGRKLRWWGLEPSWCLAVELTDELRAEIEEVYVEEKRCTRGEGECGGWVQYRERGSGKVLGQVWVGGYQGRDRGFHCRNMVEVLRLHELVVPKSAGVLPPVAPVTELTNARFPVRRRAVLESVGPEVEVGPPDFLDSDHEKAMEKWENFGFLTDNGHVFIVDYWESNRKGSGPAGYNLHVVRPGLRRMVDVVDEGRRFPRCHLVRKKEPAVRMVCTVMSIVGPGTDRRWNRGLWLLTYENYGTPREIVEVPLENTPWAEPYVLDFEFPEKGTIRAGLYRLPLDKVTHKKRSYRTELTFRLVD